jgi:DNA-binding NtrC family response regulator
MSDQGMKTSVLVLDDEANVREAISNTLEASYAVESIGSAEEALALVQRRSFDIILCDIRLPGMDGLTFMERVLADDPTVTAIAITGYASVETAVRALKRGVYDYLVKPFAPEELRKVVQRAAEARRLHRENESWRKAVGGSASAMYLGESPPMRRLYAAAEQVAETHAPVFVTGESGSGKEFLARFIHAKSPRSAKPFIAVNCATFSDNLMTSEVFGHTKGAFTGAVADRRGCLELADQGTLLLDEIAELKPELQARLLRVVEDMTLTRLGSERAIRVDVRYIAAAQKKPEELIREGKLREDLYYRLGVVTLEIPPLRERPADLPGLAEFMIRSFRAELKKEIGAVEPEALEALQRHAWPGNVRELRNVLERAAIFARPGEAIGLRHLPAPLREASAIEPFAAGAGGELLSLNEVQQRYATYVLGVCGGNRGKAAKILGVAPSTLWRWSQGAEGE